VFSKMLKKSKMKIKHFLGFQFGLYHVGRCRVKEVYGEKYGDNQNNGPQLNKRLPLISPKILSGNLGSRPIMKSRFS